MLNPFKRQQSKGIEVTGPATLEQLVHTERTYALGNAKLTITEEDGRETEYSVKINRGTYSSSDTLYIGYDADIDNLIKLLLQVRGKAKKAAAPELKPDHPQGQ